LRGSTVGKKHRSAHEKPTNCSKEMHDLFRPSVTVGTVALMVHCYFRARVRTIHAPEVCACFRSEPG
jgi:hypothetical protein